MSVQWKYSRSTPVLTTDYGAVRAAHRAPNTVHHTPHHFISVVFRTAHRTPRTEQVRAALRSELLRGFFGPSEGGVYSPSLQATIYDMGCLVLQAVPQVQQISIYTPNIHMIPAHSLKALNDGVGFQDDVYVATSEPAGTIHCTVSR